MNLNDFAKPLPRYTSYPTAPNWEALEGSAFTERLPLLSSPLSLYLHIPFCERICLFCGCSSILNRKKENEERYVKALIQEIELISTFFPEKKRISQIHFGGGSPSKLSNDLFSLLFEKLNCSFDFEPDAEVAIEVDPRTLTHEPTKLSFFRALGFNRLSFGIQDTNPQVQEAILRRQSFETSQRAVHLARELGFKEINLDLIYGLPLQTKKSFEKSVSEILSFKPERIALYSFAYLPELKPHQRAIRKETLPSTEEKFAIYTMAREAFREAGYLAIGMDHFAKIGSDLALSYQRKTLHRNFQGYSVKKAEELIGLGITAISDLNGAFFQNRKDLKGYYEAISSKKVAISIGKILSEEDHLRRFVITSLMCRFEVDKNQFFTLFGKEFDHHFASVNEKMNEFEKRGFLINGKEKLTITPQGELFIRNIASLFDSYLQKEGKRAQFSSSI